MKPLQKREISKFKRKNPMDKNLWKNLWKRMLANTKIFEPVLLEESFDEIYKKHMKWK